MKIITETFQKISKEIFDKYPDQLIEIARGRPGVYALYKNERLYYVGKAVDLRRRLEQHRKAQKRGRWNNFSLFITKKKEYISIIEAILINVANPPGNETRFKSRIWRGQRKLYRLIQRQHKLDMAKMFNKEERRFRTTSRKSSHLSSRYNARKIKRTRKSIKHPDLNQYFTSARPLKLVIKKQTYATAMLLPNGKILHQGTSYPTPSAAGKAARNSRSINGWFYWFVEKEDGTWVRLCHLKDKDRAA